MDKDKFQKECLDFIKNSNNILITSHKNPDDDSISSVLGLFHYIKSNFGDKNIKIAYTGSENNRWSYFEGFENIAFISDVAQIIDDYDLIIVLDVNNPDRFLDDVEKFDRSSIKKICIDHHASPPGKFDLIFVDPNYSSNSEIIFDFFYSENKSIEPRVAEVILLGILGDTGTFRFIKDTQSDVFLKVKKLMDFGKINIQNLQSNYMRYKSDYLELFKILMKNVSIQKYSQDLPNNLVTYIDAKDVPLTKFSFDEISAASHIFIMQYGLVLEDVSWAFVIYPNSESTYKMSTRSLPGSINARKLMEDMKIGGGHNRAAGGKFDESYDSPEKCLEFVKKFLEENKVERG